MSHTDSLSPEPIRETDSFWQNGRAVEVGGSSADQLPQPPRSGRVSDSPVPRIVSGWFVNIPRGDSPGSGGSPCQFLTDGFTFSHCNNKKPGHRAPRAFTVNCRDGVLMCAPFPPTNLSKKKKTYRAGGFSRGSLQRPDPRLSTSIVPSPASRTHASVGLGLRSGRDCQPVHLLPRAFIPTSSLPSTHPVLYMEENQLHVTASRLTQPCKRITADSSHRTLHSYLNKVP